MPKRPTIQDIANELRLSRNTVSKAINGTGVIADSTRDLILKKAAEMGYKLFNIQNAISNQNICSEKTDMNIEKKELVLFTGAMLSNSHFSTKMLDEMQLEASTLGFGFTMFRIMKLEQEECRLPSNFDINRTAGIFCVEMFDAKYNQMLCSLGIPIVFIDSNIIFNEKPLLADLLLMENRNSIYHFVKEMVNRGKKKIGFIGEAFHCMSFYERYDAFMGAIRLFGLEYNPQWCFVGKTCGLNYPSHNQYVSYLEEELNHCENLPEVFICINDFVALDVIQVLRNRNISIPNDLYLCGFDDSPEARIVIPNLTTIRINGQAMGKAAIDLLFSRMKSPNLTFRTQYIETNIIYRESTAN